MSELCTIYDYMRAHAALLGERILQEYPALHQFEDAVSPRIEDLLRKPFPAQTIAIMGVVKRWQQARTAMVVAECGTGKTLISLGTIHVHRQRSSFTAVAIVIATIKWPFGQYMLPQREEEGRRRRRSNAS
jgi:superfamily II DNA or RNA helicase